MAVLPFGLGTGQIAGEKGKVAGTSCARYAYCHTALRSQFATLELEVSLLLAERGDNRAIDG